MHGRKKIDVPKPSPEELEEQRQQVRTADALFKGLLKQRAARVYTEQALELTTKALKFHPEFPTMWGYRREILESGNLEAELKDLLAFEMELLQRALTKTQKVYAVWFHRKWVVDKIFKGCSGPEEARSLLEVELGLCAKLHKVDERNYHCWKHRAFVMGLMAHLLEHGFSGAKATPQAEAAQEAHPPPECSAPDIVNAADEVEGASQGASEAAPAAAEAVAEPPLDLVEVDLKLSTELINRNFSNYSAWHVRALLQQPPPGEEAAGAGRIDLTKELAWVQEATYVEPNDQSIWLYHRWLTTNRGLAWPRVTHCALLGGELVVFFSERVCVRGAEGAPVACSVEVHKGLNELARSAGILVPLGSEASEGGVRRTRRLPASRRRWALAWRFVPESGAQHLGELARAMAGAVEASTAELRLSTSVELLGSRQDGAAAVSLEPLTFQGRPVCCDLQVGAPQPQAVAAFARPDIAPSQQDVLRREHANVQELLEIEEGCKWALLAKGQLAWELAAASGEVAAMVAAGVAFAEDYAQISGGDQLRAGFYAEARGECMMRSRILSWLSAPSGFLEPLDLTQLGLRLISPVTLMPSFGVRSLDVSENELRGLGPLLLIHSLEELRASGNRLTGDVAEAWVLPRLRLLDVSGNSLVLGGGDARPVPSPPRGLTRLDVSRNPDIVALCAAEGAGPSRVLAKLAEAPEHGEWSVESDADGKCLCARA